MPRTADPVAAIMALARGIAGIALGEGKRSLVEARLGKRLRQLGIDLGAYADLVARDEDELTVMLDLLTTNHTAWLREASHFDDFAARVLPRVERRDRRLRVWCAAAATGEEPYTIALTVARALGAGLRAWDIGILCTDISTRALARARAGRYTDERVAALSAADRQLALELAEKGPPKVWSVVPALRALLSFARLNLMEPFPMKGPFDAIFCRNVMIYFDRETQQRLVARLAALLAPGGVLYVGHSESLSAIQHPLHSAGPAIYVA